MNSWGTRRHYQFLVAAGGLMAVLAGCASAPVAPSHPLASDDRTDDSRLDTRILTADARSVGDILTSGFTAEARGDGAALYGAAMALQSLGAHPEDGTDDLARTWLKRAAELGARPMQVAYTFRGRTLGPGYRQGRIGARGQFNTRQSFNAGQRAEIVVVPMDDAPLGLAVTDEDGAEVCAVAPSTRNLGCRWVPTFTGRSTIDVTNDNDRPVSFYIVLN